MNGPPMMVLVMTESFCDNNGSVFFFFSIFYCWVHVVADHGHGHDQAIITKAVIGWATQWAIDEGG